MRTVTLSYSYDIDDDQLSNGDAARLAGDLLADQVMQDPLGCFYHANVEIEFPEGLTADDFPRNAS